MKKAMIGIFSSIILSVLIVACTPDDGIVDFKEGVKKLETLDEEYDAGMITVPLDIEDVNNLHTLLLGYRASNSFEEDIVLLLDYRLKVLEAKIVLEEGWKDGRRGTTEFGFGCRMLGSVTESSKLRNQSAEIGFEAVALLEEFVDTYPDQAKSLKLSNKDVLLLKAIYFEVQEQAEKDFRIINNFCGDKEEEEQDE